VSETLNRPLTELWFLSCGIVLLTVPNRTDPLLRGGECLSER